MAPSQNHSTSPTISSASLMGSADARTALDITLTMTTGFDHRRITLEAGQKTEVGRASRSENRNAVAASGNALFDCPVVSRNHAELAYHPFGDPGKEVDITDLGSKHGTILNGKRLIPGIHYDLHSGDTIKFGGPITVGAESHDGITMMYSPVPPSPPSEVNEVQPPIQRGFRAPSYESDIDGVGQSNDYVSDFDEDYEEGERDFNDNDDHIDVDDDDDDDDDDNDDDNDDEDGDADDSADELHDDTCQTTPEVPKVNQSYNVNSPTLLRFPYSAITKDNATDTNTVIIPDSIDTPALTHTYRRDSSSLNATAHATRSTLWPGDSLRDIIQRLPPLIHPLEASDDVLEESLWNGESSKPDEDRHGRLNFDMVTKDPKSPAMNTMNPCPSQTINSTNHMVGNAKPRYDPVRSSPAAMVHTFPSFPAAGASMSHMNEPDLIVEAPSLCSAIAQAKDGFMQENHIAETLPFGFQRYTLGSTSPSTIDPQPPNTQDACSLPAVDDVVQSLTWMDQPKPPIAFNKIPIPALVERPEDEASKATESDTKHEPRDVSIAVDKRPKRKADEIEDAGALQSSDSHSAKKTRTDVRQAAGNRSGIFKGMFIGAVGGAIGTMAFLASPATEMLLDWLEV